VVARHQILQRSPGIHTAWRLYAFEGAELIALKGIDPVQANSYAVDYKIIPIPGVSPPGKFLGRGAPSGSRQHHAHQEGRNKT
jgi:hypothetical protein